MPFKNEECQSDDIKDSVSNDNDDNDSDNNGIDNNGDDKNCCTVLTPVRFPLLTMYSMIQYKKTTSVARIKT